MITDTDDPDVSGGHVIEYPDPTDPHGPSKKLKWDPILGWYYA